jgi:hypothetical protein
MMAEADSRFVGRDLLKKRTKPKGQGRNQPQ